MSGAESGRSGPGDTGPLGVHDTSGIEVRIGPRAGGAHASGRRRRAAWRGVLAVGGVIACCGVAAAAVTLWPSAANDAGDVGPGQETAGRTAAPSPRVKRPHTGAPVEVSTQDGFRYRLAGITGGSGAGVAPTLHSSTPPGTTYARADYVLTNPTSKPVILEFPGDVFVKRAVLAARSRGRCMWQPGVPTDMCTPPNTGHVVSRLAGGAPQQREGDRYMPSGASYVVRVTIDVPVDKRIRRNDMRLYVWKHIFMADQLAKEVPFAS